MTIDKDIFIKNIYYMLSYAFQELRQNNYTEIQGETFENVFDLFAEILAKGISHQLKQGLYKEYISLHETTATLKGKIDLVGTFTQKIQNKQRIACEFDELSEDNYFNQILTSTVDILIKHSDVNKERKSQLKKLMLFFKKVKSTDVRNIKWRNLRFDRNNRSYRMLLYICYFIINEWLLTTDEGNYKLREFSDDHMSRLYEKFLLEYFKRHHPECKPRAAQINWNFAYEQISAESLSVLPIMQTDIFMEIGDRVLIIDAKYYSQSLSVHLGKNILHTPNFYQINSYVLNYDSSHSGKVDGMLLYAQSQNTGTLSYDYLGNDGNIFYVRTLDLNQPFLNIKEQLEGFIKH